MAIERPEHVEKFISPGITTKIDSEQGIIEAIVNVFGIVDLGNDICVNGCCAKTIQERGRKIRILNSHDTSNVLNAIGVCLDIRELNRAELPDDLLKEFPESTGGLWMRTQFMLDDPTSAAVFKRIKVGAIDEYSIGYETIQSEYKKTDWRGDIVNARLLKEIRLWEVSSVIFGMNQATLTTGVKTGASSEAEPEDKDITMTTSKGMGAQPQPCMGDYLSAKMRAACNQEADYSLMCGSLTAVEHKAVSDALHAGIEAFTKALPETVAAAPRVSSGFGWFSADDPDGKSKIAKLQAKAGRVLSGGNTAIIQSVIDGIESQLEVLEKLLADAGVIDPAEDEIDPPEDAPAEDMSKANTQAGPDDVPPTDETRKRLLERILSELEN